MPCEKDIKFLIADIDPMDIEYLKKYGNIQENEAIKFDFKRLRNGNDLVLNEEMKKILPNGFHYRFDGSVNSFRIFGRIALLEHGNFQKFYETLKNTIESFDVSKGLCIHIVTSIFGGTGSGILIDIPYMIRHILKTLGFEKNQIHLSARLLLVPNGFFCSTRENGYATLKEVNYFMQLTESKESFTFAYPEPMGEFESHENIFDSCLLFDLNEDEKYPNEFFDIGYDIFQSINCPEKQTVGQFMRKEKHLQICEYLADLETRYNSFFRFGLHTNENMNPSWQEYPPVTGENTLLYF